MKTLKKQHGLGMLGWLVVLGLGGFMLLCAFKIVPLYAENFYVVASLKSLVEPGEKLEDMTTAEIKAKMQKFYMVNNVRAQGPQDIVVTRSADKIVVKIDYEARANLISNLDVAVVFKNHLDSTNIQACCKPLDEK